MFDKASGWYRPSENVSKFPKAILQSNKCPRCGHLMTARQNKHRVDSYGIAPDGKIDDYPSDQETLDDGWGEMTVECRTCGFILQGYPVWDEPTQGRKFEFHLYDLDGLVER